MGLLTVSVLTGLAWYGVVSFGLIMEKWLKVKKCVKSKFAIFVLLAQNPQKKPKTIW